MAQQTQIRRGTDAENAAFTGAAGEVVANTTKNRLHLHDGATAGGVPQAAAFDVQDQAFQAADATGTADAIAISLSPAPGAYAKYQRFVIKAAQNNTGAATLEVNGLGAVALKKMDGGALADLEADDIVGGGIYGAVHDGSVFQLENLSGPGTITQSDLSTATGEVSTASQTGSLLTLPGGAYGFWPQIRTALATTAPAASLCLDPEGDPHQPGTSFITTVLLQTYDLNRVYARQRYIQASPPYDLGDGPATTFLFALVESGGAVVATYQAAEPPWANNGPTDIRPAFVRDGKAWRWRRKAAAGPAAARARAEALVAGTLDVAGEYEAEEITQKVKQADMTLIPHPFTGNDLTGRTVVMLDPVSDLAWRLAEMQGMGESPAELFAAGHLRLDNEALPRRRPPGVTVVRAKL